MLNNGLGDYRKRWPRPNTPPRTSGARRHWALVELIEAAVRSGMSETAAEGLRPADRNACASGTGWALGVEARSRALLSEGDTAEGLYRDSIERLGRPASAPSLPALTCSTANGYAANDGAPTHAKNCARPTECWRRWAWRASRIAPAASCSPPVRRARNRTVTEARELTAQEPQIARLARDGLSNPEIGARLFISPHTVEYHLSKVFAKLDISSRSQLGGVLPGSLSGTVQKAG